MKNAENSQVRAAFRGVLVSASLVASFAFFLSSGAQAEEGTRKDGANICLNTTEILNTHPVDSRTILFRMRNGKVWRNRLAAPCPDLVAQGGGGFSQYAHTDYICANTQTITVVATGQVCRLGQFTPVE